jgi:hypothetical protein
MTKNVDWGDVKEKAAGVGKKLLDDINKSQQEADDNMASRLNIWRQALQMCNADRDAFWTEANATHVTLKKMMTPVELSAEAPKWTLGKELSAYLASYGSTDKGDVTKAETTQNTEDFEAW